MRKAGIVFVLTLAGIFVGNATSEACCLRLDCLRFIHSCIARPVVVVAARPVVVAPPGIVVPPPMPPAGLPGPIVSKQGELLLPPTPLALAPAPVLTHQDFARLFKPLPGRYEVTLLHPGSRCPVAVCFTLPEGCPRVVVRHRELVFDYGRHEVEVRFAIFGKVKVNYR